MQNIEQTIVELGGIFQQLAHMVKEQEEVVQRSVSSHLPVRLAMKCSDRNLRIHPFVYAMCMVLSFSKLF